MRLHHSPLNTPPALANYHAWKSRLVAQDQPQQQQVSPANPGATGNYNFLIASGFLCDPNDSASCPAVARASDGETVEITGAGSLSGQSVIAVGSFTQKTSNGSIVTTGVWTGHRTHELRVLRDRSRSATARPSTIQKARAASHRQDDAPHG